MRLLIGLGILLGGAAMTDDAHAQFAKPLVLFTNAQGDQQVQIELARSPQEMAKGLMFRQKLAEDAGMLFIYKTDGDHSFWMKNTYIPLDMLFIDVSGRVVGIVENAAPLTLVSRSVGQPSRYVLEVNAGYCRRHGLTVGSQLRLVGIGL